MNLITLGEKDNFTTTYTIPYYSHSLMEKLDLILNIDFFTISHDGHFYSTQNSIQAYKKKVFSKTRSLDHI
jgi:hypothetical protein